MKPPGWTGISALTAGEADAAATYRRLPADAGGYRGRVLEVPGAEATGATLPAARRNLAAALRAAMQGAAADNRHHWADLPEIFREPLLLLLGGDGVTEEVATDAGKLLVTGIYLKDARWYLAYVAEIPGAFALGETFGEARRNLRETLQLILECYRDAAQEASTAHSPAGITAPAFPVPSA